MATSGRRAQEAIRAHGSKKCSKHGKKVIYVCENCDVLACVDCATQQHKGHKLEGISNVVPGAKQKLKNFIKMAEEKDIPRIKEKLRHLNSDFSKNRKQSGKLVSEIKKQNETLKQELDKIADTMVNTCHDMEHQNLGNFLNNQKKLQTQLDKLSSNIQEVKATLQSGNDVLVYDTSHVIPSEFEDLPTPYCSTAEFSQGKLQLQQLEHLLGELNITDHCRPCFPFIRLVNCRVMSEFTPYKGRQVQSIHAAGDEVWLSDCSKTMCSVNQKGQVQQTLHMSVCVSDFCILPQTGNIWFCSYDDNSVREVKNGKEEVKFKTDPWPCCICVTRGKHVLVGCRRQIVKYTQTGDKICTTSGGTRPVASVPLRMSECPLTGHITFFGGDVSEMFPEETAPSYVFDQPCVYILNDQLQLLHTYKFQSFISSHPRGVCYTDTGELVITHSNKSVVLWTGRGRYVQTLFTASESVPLAVSVHSDALWVSLFNGKVQVLKYN